MKTLDKDWLTTGLIDFEYKKYVLLAYLQHVKSNFKNQKLYPDLRDLQYHYEYSKYFKDGIEQMSDLFPKRIRDFNTDDLNIVYESSPQPDNHYITELESIMNYALPRFENAINEGEEIVAEVQDNINVTPIGILPLYKNDGYLLVHEPTISETLVYQYNLTVFEGKNEKLRGVKTFYVETVRKSVSTTFENIKLDLVKKYKHLPNPATYLVESKYILPLEETLLPIAKWKIVEEVTR
ncbi:hypothetical protein VB796_00615 [Arcicella sp. LKC2W]|uniref:hypothetical protein n=1 Tax=Arcicella sp. LKC2W TaxID=2984198 RepID=UPI002B1EFE29|nr:hypothetical protein [Arcicella sp. LKC2W]MEA5457519.1 hypothetical protein [Arcicella sp. LKC2W]